ncbi:MAG: methylated-DNA--[protein]-cysteine S-methyltransferase [Betaproteobacteria bacterium]|nr:methylated-DNA--[protein]-cysteine S-methyltransferase [Betaproteobacteria bacterium]
MQTIVTKARAYLDSRQPERVTLEELAGAVGSSPFHLQREFKRVLGLSPRDYQREHRLEHAKRLIAKGGRVTDAVFEAGYGSVSRFYEKAASRLGMRASDYRARGKGLRIAYAVRPSALGHILLAATERGLCSVKLGADAGSLERALAEEYAEAELERDAQALAPSFAAIDAFLAGDASLAQLPLDVRGTVFQRRVWEELRKIPRGETRTYQQIARAIGKPRAVRAVGSACGANPVALVIPCHRALRTDGGLGGYAWGVEKKEKLLALEKRGRR